MFVEYTCGCIGLKPDTKARPVIFFYCGATDGQQFCCARINGTNKQGYVELGMEAQDQFMRQVGLLIADGYSMREVRLLLKT